MAQTQTYKKSLSGSIGAGMKSLVGSEGRRYYVLEHKVSSRYHKAGEAQRIIVDQIELGRDSQCQVRFDESFQTVSRRHAAIVKDGDNWKLVQLSQTNSTYLNGRKVEKEWYLQSGDEIQLSTNGPKLGFIVPQGDKSLVKSIGLTARMNLFRQQALRPYKTAIYAMAAIVVLMIAGFSVFAYQSKNHIDRLAKDLIESQRKQEELVAQVADVKIRSEEEKTALLHQLNNMEKKLKKAIVTPTPAHLSTLERDVFWIHVYKVEISAQGRSEVIKTSTESNFGWIATGFLLNDGRFVTARHCVEGWRYPQGDAENMYISLSLCECADAGVKVKAYMKAYSKTGASFEFTSDQFVMGKALVRNKISYTDDEGKECVLYYNEAPFGDDDFAYVKTGKKGSLQYDASLSKSLPHGGRLFVLGYPHGLGAGAEVDEVSKLAVSYSETNVSRSGLNENGYIQVSNRGFESGNSGGPVFVMKDGEPVVVGIVSSGRESIGFVTPIAKIEK